MATKPSIPAEMLGDMMDVYTAHPATGAYTVIDRGAISCRLALIRPGTTGAQERAELATLRRLFWGPNYVMPDHAQVLIDGARWNVVQDTLAASTWIDGTAINYQCDVVRVD